MQKEIQDSAYNYLKQVESGERTIVGVNKFQIEEPTTIKSMKVDDTAEMRQIERLNKVRRNRDNGEVKGRLKELKEAAIEGVNLVPPCLAAVKAYASVGEMCNVLREVWGEYKALSI